MIASARFFPVEGIVSALTGAPLSDDSVSETIELLSYVNEGPVSADESSATFKRARRDLRQQLPTPLAEFRIQDLANFVIEARIDSKAPLSREAIIRLLQKRLGVAHPICPSHHYKQQLADLNDIFGLASHSTRNSNIDFDSHGFEQKKKNNDQPIDKI